MWELADSELEWKRRERIFGDGEPE